MPEQQVTCTGEHAHTLEARGLAYVARAAVCRMQPQHIGLGAQAQVVAGSSVYRGLRTLPAVAHDALHGLVGALGRPRSTEVTPRSFGTMGGAEPSKTPLFSGHFEGAIAALWQASHSSSRSAAARTAFLAHAKFAMSLSRPPESVDRHMPGYLLSATTRPKLRRPASKTQPVPSRRQVRRWDLR